MRKSTKSQSFTSDKTTDVILAKMAKCKINKSYIIRRLLVDWYFKEMRYIERSVNHTKRMETPFDVVKHIKKY